MDELIPVINKLQDVFNAIGHSGIDLPQIVVVGSQSSGKSSVLENIVGRDFLPRGQGIVTRRPLVLQLVNLPPSAEAQGTFSEWGEFLHKPDKMFYNFSEIRDEIQAETDRLTGRNKGVSNLAINLKIYSPHVLNLTLVDLPGMTKVPVGDQPSDIEAQIRRMCLEYIEKPSAVILAVSSANTDLANSDSLQLAKLVDPSGMRTLGVITKLDLMDAGTDALDVLTGRVIPLRLGYVAVINRSQQDIISKKPIRDALKNEAQFFATHPAYKSIAQKSGTAYLSRTLNKVLVEHIRNSLPELRQRINSMLQDAQREMEQYGGQPWEGKNSQGALLLNIITRFSHDYRSSIEGTATDVNFDELHGGARVNFIFAEVFARHVNSINPTDGLTLNEIRTAIRNANGPKAALFVPESSFELLVRRQIARLEEPALQCVELVYDELQRIVSQTESKELLRFSGLRERVVDVTNALLNKCRDPTKTMIRNLVQIELAYVNTNHPDFIGGGGALTQVFERLAEERAINQHREQMQAQMAAQANGGGGGAPQPVSGGAAGAARQQNSAALQQHQQQLVSQRQQQNAQAQAAAAAKKAAAASPGSSANTRALEKVPQTIRAGQTPTEKEKFETELIQSLLVSYFDIVRKNIKDTIPKTIMHFLVNASKENIQNELVSQLYREDLFEELLEESPAIASKRAACSQMLTLLKRANEILNEVRDFRGAN